MKQENPGKKHRETSTGEARTSQIEGRRAVLEALRAKRTLNRLYILDGCHDAPVEAIRREGLQQFTRRDIMRACRMLATAEAAQKVLDHLETLGYVGVKGDENDKKNFHGKNLYHANPCIFSDPDAT